ncbi:hypothetical protein BJY00DRAFT_320105 [Aspergillus carlsbadensis]|nr:hypothetical protein BJY00DRAFT_320105 [Aspergillus carlsbadensis]
MILTPRAPDSRLALLGPIALPTLAAHLKTGALYIWAINSYFPRTAAVQPLFGQAADIIALTATLPAVQAPLPEQDVAVATACWEFMRSFGSSWGAAIPAANFNLGVDSLLYKVRNEEVRVLLRRGGAYERAIASFIKSFDNDLRVKQQLVGIYTSGIKESWRALVAFMLVAVPLAGFIK